MSTGRFLILGAGVVLAIYAVGWVFRTFGAFNVFVGAFIVGSTFVLSLAVIRVMGGSPNG